MMGNVLNSKIVEILSVETWTSKENGHLSSRIFEKKEKKKKSSCHPSVTMAKLN